MWSLNAGNDLWLLSTTFVLFLKQKVYLCCFFWYQHLLGLHFKFQWKTKTQHRLGNTTSCCMQMRPILSILTQSCGDWGLNWTTVRAQTICHVFLWILWSQSERVCGPVIKVVTTTPTRLSHAGFILLPCDVNGSENTYSLLGANHMTSVLQWHSFIITLVVMWVISD